MEAIDFIHRLKKGATFTNHFLLIPSAWTAELAGLAAYDSVTIDMQHGLMDMQQTIAMLQALSATQTPGIVRIPWHDPAAAMKVLDAGAEGVLCPMIDTAADAERFVQACKYPPEGYRSFGPIRVGARMGADYFENANRSHLTLVMIETAKALENLEAIAAVEGLDGLFVGPSDLSISMGWPKGDVTFAPMQEALKRVVQLCKEKGLISAVFTTDLEDAVIVAKMGFQLQSFSGDSLLLQQAHQYFSKALKELYPS